MTIAGCAVLVIAVGCSKSAPSSSSSPKPSASAAAAGMPFYNVSVSNFTYHGAPSAVPANKPFVISFTNKESFEIIHEFVVVKVPAGKTAQDVIKDTKQKGAKAEDDWIHMGDSGDVPTGATSTFTLDLPPGNYVAACWQTGKAGGGTGPPHITIGMVAPFTASTSAPVPATAGAPAFYNVSVSNFTYHGAPSAVPANKPFVISFTNKESFEIIHEFVVVKVPAGKTAQDVIKDTKQKGAKAEDDWIHMGDSGDVPTGATSTFTLDLPPGNYVAACWQTGKAGGGTGPPHITIGMVAPFTAS